MIALNAKNPICKILHTHLLLLILCAFTVPVFGEDLTSPSSATVQVDGVEISVTTAQEVFGADEFVVLNVLFRNVSGKELAFYDLSFYSSWTFSFRNTKTDEVWDSVPTGMYMRTQPETVVLKDGESHAVKAMLAGGRTYRKQGGEEGNPANTRTEKPAQPIVGGGFGLAESGGQAHLPEGTYEARAQIRLRANPQPEQGKTYWTAQAQTAPVFKGRLEGSSQLDPKMEQGFASTLMRTHYYRLGNWTIYTGAQRVEALTNAVGKPVQIVGKEIKMELEGQSLQEIWPASIELLEEPKRDAMK